MESLGYFTDIETIKIAESLGLALDEIEHIVGRFKSDHLRFPGQLKGELVVTKKGMYIIRHHFTKKELWRAE